LGASSTFWHHPVDVLRWVLDIAGLAVKTVLRVDLQLLPPGSPLVDVLVNTRGAEPVLRPIKSLVVLLNWHFRVLQRQMDRLVVLVVCSAASKVFQQLKGDHAIGLGVLNLFAKAK